MLGCRCETIEKFGSVITYSIRRILIVVKIVACTQKWSQVIVVLVHAGFQSMFNLLSDIGYRILFLFTLSPTKAFSSTFQWHYSYYFDLWSRSRFSEFKIHFWMTFKYSYSNYSLFEKIKKSHVDFQFWHNGYKRFEQGNLVG